MTGSHLTIRMARTVVRHWLLFAVLCLSTGVIAAVLSTMEPREWQVPFAFVAESDEHIGGGIASELGLGSSSSDSPDFYVDLLKTNDALLPLTKRRYRTNAGTTYTLVELLDVKGRNSDEQVAKTLKVLHRRIVPTSSRRSGVVSVMVTLPDPLVAKTVADELLDAVNTVNSRVRQTKGRNERIFTEDRLIVLRGELRVAEENLRHFLEGHRVTASSPTLQLERLRLEREITTKTATLEDMQVGFETARREEVKNTPRISVIEPPRVPALGQPRNTARKALLTMAATALLLLLVTNRADNRASGSVRHLVRDDYRALKELLSVKSPPAAATRHASGTT
jgi:hypothetical protein